MAPYYVLVVGADEERVLKCRLMANDEIVKEPFAVICTTLLMCRLSCAYALFGLISFAGYVFKDLSICFRGVACMCNLP